MGKKIVGLQQIDVLNSLSRNVYVIVDDQDQISTAPSDRTALTVFEFCLNVNDVVRKQRF